MTREVLLTKEEYLKLKERFMGWDIPKLAKLKINTDIIRIEKIIVRDKIQYWISIDGEYSTDKEKLKLYGFGKKKKMYKGTEEKIYKDFIKAFGKKEGTAEAEKFIKEHSYILYIPYCFSYSSVERMLKKHKEVYWLKEDYEE
ncbi:hypothetical protein [Fusobacterium sp. THCT1E2]